MNFNSEKMALRKGKRIWVLMTLDVPTTGEVLIYDIFNIREWSGQKEEESII